MQSNTITTTALILPLLLTLTLLPALAFSKLHDQPPAPDAIFDYIFIGGGTGGLPLAARLSESKTSPSPPQNPKDAQTGKPPIRPRADEMQTQRRSSGGANPPPADPAMDQEMPKPHGDLLVGDPSHSPPGQDGNGRAPLTVAVLEAGMSERDNELVKPAMSIASFGKAFGTRVDWGYKSAKQEGTNGKSVVYHAGKGLGGTSLINGQTYLRPHHAQIDAWQDVLGSSGWNWESLLPYYLKSEQFQTPTSPQQDAGMTYSPQFHGSDGAVKVGWMNNLTAGDFYRRVRDTYKNLGFQHIDDANNGDPAGFSVWPLTLDREKGMRWDAANAYLWPVVKNRENLNVYQNVTVNRIVWEDSSGEKGEERKAKGVEYVTQDGKKMVVNVRKDVVVSAGSLRSPAILEQSGVGNPSVLSKLKTPVEVELPSLGSNLQDQVLFSVLHNSSVKITGFTPYVTTVTAPDLFGKDLQSIESRVRKQIPTYAKRNVDGSAPGSTNATIQEKLLNLQADLIFKKNVPCAEILTQASDETIGSTAWGLLPFSRGHSHAAPGNSSNPDIDPKFLMLEWDQILSVATAKLARKALETKPFADISTGEVLPGKKVVPDGASDDEWLKYIKQGYTPNYHPVGSAPMMSRELGGVVDKELNVYGTENVRVMDASVLPFQVVGHLTSTIYAMAEKVADEILKPR